MADVVGVDSSAEMIAAASEVLAGTPETPRLRFEQMDACAWSPDGPVDVIVSNAMLHWIPDNESLLVKWVSYLADDGWLAFQVPGNHDQPTYRLLRELGRSDRWRERLSGVALTRQEADPAEYLDLLAEAGCGVDAWESTYLQVLAGDDPVLRWISGSGLRPVIAALDGAERDEFLAEYGSLLRDAYPRGSYGTVFPFRRVFVVAHKP